MSSANVVIMEKFVLIVSFTVFWTVKATLVYQCLYHVFCLEDPRLREIITKTSKNFLVQCAKEASTHPPGTEMDSGGTSGPNS